MIISAVLSFLGGSAFRMIWGEVSSFLNKKLDHAHEIASLQLQEQLEIARSQRQEQLIRMQHDLGIKEIQVAGDIAVEKAAADAFTEAMKVSNRPTGIKWVDAWNSGIRPSAASIALMLWVGNLIQAALVLTEWDRDLIGAIFGYFFADRSLGKRGK